MPGRHKSGPLRFSSSAFAKDCSICVELKERSNSSRLPPVFRAGFRRVAAACKLRQCPLSRISSATAFAIQDSKQSDQQPSYLRQ